MTPNPEIIATSLSMVSLHLLCEYAVPWKEGSGAWLAILRGAVFFLPAGILTLALWRDPTSLLVTAGVTLGRELLRLVFVKAPFFRARPFDRELGTLLILALWVIIIPSMIVLLGGSQPSTETWWLDPLVLRPLTTLAGLALAIRGGTIFIRALLHQLGKEPPENHSAPHLVRTDYQMGRVIGNVERILIFALVLGNHLNAAGIVLAAKSIARFEDLKERSFAEYYLVGTLTSALVALTAGKLVVYAWSLISPVATP